MLDMKLSGIVLFICAAALMGPNTVTADEPADSDKLIFHDDFSGKSKLGKVAGGVLLGGGKTDISDKFGGEEFTFEYRFNARKGGGARIYTEKDSYGLTKASDQHTWFGGAGMRLAYVTLFYSGVSIKPDDKWHTVRFVKEKKHHKVTVYYDNKAIRNGVFYVRPAGRLKSIHLHSQGGRFDDIKVWRRAIHMPTKASYDTKTKTIVLTGKGHTPASISKRLGDSAVFKYDAKSSKAVCKANIRIEGAAELILNGETLLMANGTKLAIDSAGEIHMRKSKLAASEGSFDFHTDWTSCIIEIEDSTLDGVRSLVAYPRFGFLRNTRLTNIGRTTTAVAIQPAYFDVDRLHFKGGDITFQNVWGNYEFFHNPMPGSYLVNSTFELGEGKLIAANNYVVSLINCKWDDGSSPARLAFGKKLHTIPSPDEDEFMVRYFLDVKVVDKNGKAVPGAIVEVINESPTARDKKWKSLNMSSMWDALGVSVDGNRAIPLRLRRRWGASTKEKGGVWWQIRELYYWCATPVVMNMQRKRHVGHIRHTKYWLYTFGQPNNSAKTGANGHTPLPAEDPKSTLVITDYRKTNGKGITEYKYTIRARTPSGKTGTVTGVNPEADWYRKNPGKYQNTVTVKVK